MSKSVVITGHRGGIGDALVSAFHEHGYHVVGIDRESGPSTADVQISFDLATLIHPAAIESLQAELDKAVNDHQLEGLVNNAAIQHLGQIQSLDIDRFIDSFNVNVLAPLSLSRILLPALTATRGAIVNISSIHSTQTKAGFSPYSISKAGLSALTRAMAIELGSQLRVMEVRPAAISTPMLEAGFIGHGEKRERLASYHPTMSIGSPQEAAATIVQLFENKDPFLNGCVLNMDGGISHLLHDPD